MFCSRSQQFCFCLIFLICTESNASGQSAPSLAQAAARHHIRIGAAVSARYLNEPPYGQILASEFSQLQPENEMKFGVVHRVPGTYDFRPADLLVAFAQSHNLAVRGHTLVWHRQVPSWVGDGHYSPSQLSGILHDHISTVMSHYKGKVYAWDVVNEAFNDDGTLRSTIWYDQPGIGLGKKKAKYIQQVFEWAHAADPQAKLFYNDYDAEPVNRKSDAIYEMAKEFKHHHVPIDGIGFQFHVSLKFADPEKLASVEQNFKRFAALGLELNITELDIRLGDETPESLQAQAKVYAAITKICAQQPACKLLQTWGITDKHSWIPQEYKGMGWALLWDAGYHAKPAYYGVLDALQ